MPQDNGVEVLSGPLLEYERAYDEDDLESNFLFYVGTKYPNSIRVRSVALSLEVGFYLLQYKYINLARQIYM